MRIFPHKAALELVYKHYDTCGCGGALTYKYRKIDKATREELWIKPTMGLFQKFKDGVNVRSGKLDKLLEAL